MPRGRVAASDGRPRDASDPLATGPVVGSLVALVTVAIAQPLLDLIGRNAAFLVAHDATSLDVVVVALGLTLALPAALAGVVVVLRRLHRPTALATLSAFVAVLVALLALVVVRRAATSVPSAVAVLAAAAAGAGGAWLYRRSPAARRALAWAALTAPAVAVLFVVATPASALVFGGPASASVRGIGPDAPPVVVAVFDELPVASLLDRHGQIDEAAFPAFARLADDATFFRNATGVAGQTSDAIPAALTGRYADLEALPVAADHPENLFTLLGESYDLHVLEPLTHLCPPARCSSGAGVSERYPALLRDLVIVGAHAVLPQDLATRLPAIDHGWRDFRSDATALGKEVAVRDRFRAERENHPAIAFERFVDEIRATAAPTLHFVHTLLPHRPWIYLSDGRSYAATRDVAGMESGVWLDDPSPVWHSYQRHLVQAQLADRLLDQLMSKLVAEGIYDDALVVVMADHGVSFTPGTSLRVVSRETFGEIAAVPLIVKLPGQRDEDLSDLPVETIDVLPSVLDMIGADIPAAIDGRSVFADDAPRRTKRFDYRHGTLTVPARGDEKWPVVERKNELFTHDGPLDYPYNLAPDGLHQLLGAAVAPAAAVAPSLTARLDPAPPGVEAPTALISGVIETATDPLPTAVALAVDGVVQAVTLPDAVDGTTAAFRFFVPPEALPGSPSAVELFAVGDDGLSSIPVTGG